MPSSAFAGGVAGRRPLRELQRSADADRPAARRRDARVKAAAKDDATPARALEDPALRSSLQGLAERILAEAPSRDEDDDDDDDDDDDAGGNANLRGETGDVEATSMKKMADNTLAYAAANSTAVNARGAVLARRVGHIARSTAASRARSRSATPSPERGGRPGWRPNGAPEGDERPHRSHRRGRGRGSGRRASPEVRACAEATDRLVAAVTRQRAATAARGLVFEDAEGNEGTEGNDDDDDDAPSCASSLSESDDGEPGDEPDEEPDASVRGILRGFASAATTNPSNPSEPLPEDPVHRETVTPRTTTSLASTLRDPIDDDGVYRAAKSFADELRGVSASAACIVAERLGRCETDRMKLALQLDETKRRLETAVSFAAEVRDVCAAKDEAIAAKEAELAEARAALAAAAARTLAGMSLEAPLKIVDYRGFEASGEETTTTNEGDSNSKTLTRQQATHAADLEEELRATRAAHAEERAALEREMAAKDEERSESTGRMAKERDSARAALRDAEMELQEADKDVTRLKRALAESKDANKSAEDVAAAESKMVDELRGRIRELEEAKGVLEARMRTVEAEANGEADMRADASADKRAAREDLAAAKSSSIRFEPSSTANGPTLK